jgi:DNA-binding SARP family transcriptional activator/tetratricopeptide (TPR) repeat protein
VTRLTLRLFGGFHALLGAEVPLPLTARKAQALLAYLAVRPGQAHPRDKLATLLWPDTSDDQARQSLRVALVALRRALPVTEPPILIAEAETLGLAASAVDVDVVAFERCVLTGTPDALAEAARLYRGDFLEGFRITEAPFEDWLTAERGRLYELAVEGLAKLLQHQLAEGQAAPAVQTALRLVSLDPLQEAVHRSLMRLYTAQGRRGSALKQYQACVTVLRRELGTDPEIETRRLYQEILRRPSTSDDLARDATEGLLEVTSSAAPGRPDLAGQETPLFGREAELEQLRRLLEDAVKGKGHVAVIMGEAGIGKTRLLSALAAEGIRRRCRVLLGHCYESDSILPFGPWVEACRSSGLSTDQQILGRLTPARRAELSRLLPEVYAPGLPRPGDSDLRLFEGVTELIEQAAVHGPMVFMLEDLHWADEMSLRLLAFVSRRAESFPVLLVATARVEDLADATMARQSIREVLRGRHAMRLELSPLSPADTYKLVQALVRDTQAIGHVQQQVWEISEGNPFVVLETTRAINEGTCSPDADLVPVPQQVREMIAGRLERLSDCARALAEVAAIIGREFDFTLLHRAGGLDESLTAEGVEELVRRSVLRQIGARFGFSHERIRAVVQEQVLPPQRKLRHRRVAEALEALRARELEHLSLTIGTHFREAQIWDKALKYLRKAGAEAQARSANREAVAVFEQALAARQQLPDSPETLSEELDIRLELGPCLGAVHGDGSPEKEAAYVAARELCVRLDDRPRLFPALWGQWHVSFNRGLYGEARDLGNELLSLARQLGDPVFLLEAHHSLWTSLYGTGELEAAEFHAREGLEKYDTERHRVYASIYGGHDTGVCCLNFAALTAWTRGYPDRALGYTREALRLADRIGHPFSRNLALYYAAWVHCQRGEHSATAEKAKAALHSASAAGLRSDRTAVLARVGGADVLNEAELACLHQTARPPWWLWTHTFLFCLLAEAYARSGLPERGLAVIAEIPERAMDTVYGSEVHRCRGELLMSQADAHAPEAEMCFRTAIELARHGGSRSLELRAATSLSRLLAQLGRRDEALQILSAVYGWFTEGFDTADLSGARTLLDELSAAPN